jgi:hypothetical protein
MYVHETDGLPGWSYSIGLYDSFRHPEIIIFGLPSDVMNRAINILAETIRSGKMYEAGFEYQEPFDGIKCVFHLVDKSWYPIFAGRAIRFYEGQDFPLLQCIWPDREKNYPWHNSRKKTDGVAHAAKNPISMEIGAQIIDEDVGIEQHLSGH